METIILSTVIAQLASRSHEVFSSLYDTPSKPQGPIVIEVTSEDGTTSSTETILPLKKASSSLSKDISKAVSSILDITTYHLHTIWLFTYNDIKTALVPWTLFGLCHALSASYLNLNVQTSTLSIISRIPIAMAWLWLNLLPFAISNQRQPDSIVEDSINKSWRPIAAKRITATNATYLLLASYIVAFSFSLHFGGVSQCVALAFLGFLYNECHGSNYSWISRHLLNGLGFISFGCGAMEALFGQNNNVAYFSTLISWLRIIVLVVFTGIQAADLYDQEGDAACNRKTMPLVLGDEVTRYILAAATIGWSFLCPAFWSLGLMGYLFPVLTGSFIAQRTLTARSVKDDKKTYKMWCLWLVTIYCLPLMKVACA